MICFLGISLVAPLNSFHSQVADSNRLFVGMAWENVLLSEHLDSLESCCLITQEQVQHIIVSYIWYNTALDHLHM